MEMTPLKTSDKLRQLARRIKRVRRAEFNMAYFTPKEASVQGCGTACCLAGHAILEFASPSAERDNFECGHSYGHEWEGGASAWAEELLGLGPAEADNLFHGEWVEFAEEGYPELGKISKAAAIRELNRLADELEEEGR